MRIAGARSSVRIGRRITGILVLIWRVSNPELCSSSVSLKSRFRRCKGEQDLWSSVYRKSQR